MTDNAGHAFGYTYDTTTGDLLSIRDPLNYTTTFAYTNHNLTTISDPRGTLTQITFDASSRVKTVTVGGTLLATFNYSAGVTTFTDGNNHTTTYAVNSNGLVTQRTDAANKTTTYLYGGGAAFKPRQVTDPLGRVTKATYNPDGYMLTRTDALNQVTTHTYNTTNDLLTVTDPLNRVTTYTYDADGNVLTVKNALNKKTTYTYNARGQRLTATDANNHTTTYTYTNGHLASITDPLNHAQ
ncbi:MAG: RHS repeat protein, partial [Chloroflexi bacterium]|nr:RHS repeat protein [Chloroflexota bacterium]